MSGLLDAALSYAASGWSVFPVERPVLGDERSGKRPVGWLVPNGVLNATTDPAIIRSWWSQYEDANIGIACEASGLVVLDKDITKGKHGNESLAAIDQYLEPTLTAETGSKGWHAYYQRPEGFKPGNKIGFMDGLDLISNGYVVAPPSRHYTGGLYSWMQTIPLRPLPQYLCSVRAAGASIIKQESIGVSTIDEGNRNNALFRLGAALRNTGISREGLLAALEQENAIRFKPPLDELELRQICDSVMRRVQPQRDVALGAIVEDTFKVLYPEDETAKPDNSISTGLEIVPALIEQAGLPVVSLPFDELNKKLDGLSLHSLTLIVAGTGKGKSSLAGQISTHHARTQGPVIYYVGEMTRELVVARIVGQILGKSWSYVLRNAKDMRAEIEQVLEGLPIYFVKRSDEPIKAILAGCIRARDEKCGGIPLVVVDYIQLLASVGADMRISTMQAIRDLRQVVETAPIIALILSQTSRGGATRLREGAESSEELGNAGAETSELELACTNQLVLSFKSVDDAIEHDVTMMVAKSRFGGGSKLGFKFNGKTGIWTPLDAPPIDKKRKDRMDLIYAQLAAHGLGKCNDGMFCGAKANRAMLLDKKSAHFVHGNCAQHNEAIDALVKARRIKETSGQFTALAEIVKE